MRSSHLILLACSAALACAPASAKDWARYIADFGVREVGHADKVFSTVNDVVKDIDPTRAVPSYAGWILKAANFEADAVSRSIKNNISPGEAFAQQAAITGSEFTVNSGFQAALASCFASGACAISTASGLVALGTTAAFLGAAYDSYAVGKIAEGFIDERMNSQKLAETQQEIQILQQRVAQESAVKQASLKQVLQAQRMTPQWQAQRTSQLAQLKQPIFPSVAATGPNLLQSKPPSAGPSIITVIPGSSKPSSTAATPIQPNSLGGPRLYEIGVGPARIVNTFGGPVAIGEPAEIGPIARPVQIGTPTNIGSPGDSKKATTASNFNSLSLGQFPTANQSIQGTLPAQFGAPTSPLKNGPAVTQIVPGNTPENVPFTIIPGSNTASSSQAAKSTSPTPYIYIQTTTFSSQPTTAQTGQGSSLSVNELNAIKAKADAIKPPPLPPPPTYIAPRPVSPLVGPRPGGISLSLAAAMRMRLDIDFEGTYFKDGRIILTGKQSQASQIDAALFLTALRAACEPGDPYFSLDADDGAEWVKEGSKFSNVLDQAIRKDPSISDRAEKPLVDGLSLRVVSVRRDYPALWAEHSSDYPELKTRLVFRPDWLRETRFGETLYRADVLLKELASGISLLSPNRDVRAHSIHHYISADARAATKMLLSMLSGGPAYSVSQHSERLWFDFTQQDRAQRPNETPDFHPNRLTGAAAALYDALERGGYLTTKPDFSNHPILLVSDDYALDLSQVYPKMFVHLTDLAARRDIDGEINPDFDQLARDVNARISLYEGAYPELRALTQAFRAYLIAIKILEVNRTACDQIKSIPLLPAEKVGSSLPAYRPSEIVFTYASYASRSAQSKQVAIMSTISGGISLSGKHFYRAAMQQGTQTPITRELNLEAQQVSSNSSTWDPNSGRRVLALNIDSGEMLSMQTSSNVDWSSTPAEVIDRQQALEQQYSENRQQRANEAAQKNYNDRLRNWEQLKETLERQQKQWLDAEQNWEREKQGAAARATRELARTYGPPIDRRTAELGLHYIQLAQGASPKKGDLSSGNWETILAKAGYSQKAIQIIRSSGFHAFVDEDPRTGEVTIAYGATRATGSSTFEDSDIQHDAAIALALLVRKSWLYEPITLTGYSYGGELAAFVAQQTGLFNAVIFNPPISPFVERGNPNLICIRWTEQSP